MKLTYLNIANRAAEAEREGDYLKAAQLWRKAKGLARKEENKNWAECRVCLNEKYNLLLVRANKCLEEKRERDRKYKEQARERFRLKKEAELLEANINKTSENYL